MENIVKKYGFSSFQEFTKMVSNVDLTTDDKMKAFIDWKENDGTKEGLLGLDTITS